MLYSDIAKDVETRFDTSNYDLDRPFPKGKNMKENCFKERWNRWQSKERICCIKSKNI